MNYVIKHKSIALLHVALYIAFHLKIFIPWSTDAHPKVSFRIHDRTVFCEGSD